MNKSPLTSILTGALGLSALVSLILCYYSISYTHQIRALRVPLARAGMVRQIALNIAGEAVEYGKKNPSIMPVLQASGIQVQGPGQATPPAARPAK